MLRFVTREVVLYLHTPVGRTLEVRVEYFPLRACLWGHGGVRGRVGVGGKERAVEVTMTQAQKRWKTTHTHAHTTHTADGRFDALLAHPKS